MPHAREQEHRIGRGKMSVWMIVPNLLRTLVRRDVPIRPKLLLVAGLVYLISPVDLVPDILFGVGWLDDLVIVPVLGWLSYRSLPGAVRQEVSPADDERQGSPQRIVLYLCIVIAAVGTIVLLSIREEKHDDVVPLLPTSAIDQGIVLART